MHHICRIRSQEGFLTSAKEFVSCFHGRTKGEAARGVNAGSCSLCALTGIGALAATTASEQQQNCAEDGHSALQFSHLFSYLPYT